MVLESTSKYVIVLDAGVNIGLCPDKVASQTIGI